MNENIEEINNYGNLLNCNLVYLCSPDPNENVGSNCNPVCYGIGEYACKMTKCCDTSNRSVPIISGIVRSVDKKNETIYLLPSIPMEFLQFANALALCNISMPESLLLFQNPNIIGNLPYVCNTNSTPGIRPVAENFDSSRMYKSNQS